MTLKRFAWGALTAFSLAGCGAVADSPIRILNAAALDGSCALAGSDVYVKQGKLNLAAIPTGTREISWPFYLESNLKAGTGTADDPALSDFIADRIDLSYQLQPAVGTLQPASVPVYAVIRVGSNDSSNMNIPLLPNQALTELSGLGLDANGAVLTVTFTVHGHTASGLEVKSSPVPYPIQVYSLANCTLAADACSPLNAAQTCQ